MNKISICLVFTFAVLIWSCSKKNQCDGISCFSPPIPFEFELIDKSSGENLFTSGVFSPDNINIVNLDDHSNVEFQFIDENDFNIIYIYSIGWETQTVNYAIEISSESVFSLFVDAERLSENCCAFTRYNEIKIEGTEFELDEQSGVYKIIVSKNSSNNLP